MRIVDIDINIPFPKLLENKDIQNAIEIVCKEWANYHSNTVQMPHEELIEALHNLNNLTFKIELPS